MILVAIDVLAALLMFGFMRLESSRGWRDFYAFSVGVWVALIVIDAGKVVTP